MHDTVLGQKRANSYYIQIQKQTTINSHILKNKEIRNLLITITIMCHPINHLRNRTDKLQHKERFGILISIKQNAKQWKSTIYYLVFHQKFTDAAVFHD